MPLAALAALAGACSEASTPTGRVDVALQVSPGVTLTSASYDVLAPDGQITTGAVSVGATSDVPVPIGSLPVASGYLLIVSGVASNGSVGCSGQTPFDVTEGGATTIIVHLTCGQSPATGQLLVSGDVNICPVIDGMSAEPASVIVGRDMGISMSFHDSDNGPLQIQTDWTASGPGMVEGDGSRIGLFCEAPGTVTVTVRIFDGDCWDQMSVDVTCTES